MNPAAALNRRITQLAVGRHLPHRKVRVRLTLLYGGLFLLSGAALMAIAYALLINAGFVFTLDSSSSGSNTVHTLPAGFFNEPSPAVQAAGTTTNAAGTTTNPSAQTMAHWRAVAQCMRQHGMSGFPNPTTSVPRNFRFIGQLSDRNGAMFAIPATIVESAAFPQAVAVCGFSPDATRAAAQDNQRRTQVRQELLIQSGIALAGMSLLSIVLGWLMAGRVLQPLEDSYHAQRQFVANASHELRAPLTRQRALIEVALASPEANYASLRKAHERVLASEQHLEQLIDALLALSRGQAGVERRDHLDLATLTSQAMLARESDLAGLDLDVRAELEPAPTTGDPRLLERLIANLFDNAVRYNAPGGQVEITSGTRDRHAFVSISNTGPLVPPEQIQRLFEPFQRMGGARTRHNSGHGLGLSIVQAIADAHHAQLAAHARPEGGLTIEVSFPPPVKTDPGATFAPARTKRAGPVRMSETDAAAGG